MHAQPPAPKREVRAVWITTAASLDWPRSLNTLEQQVALKQMVSDLKAAHFNTIFFQARARGDAYYKSDYEPWAENLTGIPGQDPGWDPLDFLLREAHAAGMEVHAWFNLYKVRGPNAARPSFPQHLSLAHPEWTQVHDGEVWLDPGVPEVRAYLLRVAMDLTRKYNIDGIQFDFIRYPGREFRDNETFRLYGNGMDREDWRRSNIDLFVAEFYDSAIALKPMLKVGSAPLGLYNGMNKGGGGYYSYYQDSQGWLQKMKHDYLAPQLYWPLAPLGIGGVNGNPDFAGLVRDWKQRSHGRHMYAGIGAYKPEVEREIPREIDSVRASALQGQAYFRYENIKGFNSFDHRYRTLANIPPMNWKDSIPPLSPHNLVVHELAPDIFHLEWKLPARARDGDDARSYNIYRSITQPINVDDPNNLVAITSTNASFHVDTVKNPGAVRYYYAVAALDKGNNESVPSETQAAIVREMLTIRDELANFNSLSTSVSNKKSEPTLVAYKLAKRTDVSLEVLEKGSGGIESVALRLAEGIQNEGTYVVGVGKNQLKAGRYTIRLRAGDVVLEQPLELMR